MSKLNCWPNCLAEIVHSEAGNTGRFVTCLRIATASEVRAARWSPHMGPIWVIDTVLPTMLGFQRALGLDCWMRPVTPPPGTVSETEVKELYEPSKKSTPQTAEIASSDRAVLSAVLLSARAKKGEQIPHLVYPSSRFGSRSR